jgi:hypothetical protein
VRLQPGTNSFRVAAVNEGGEASDDAAVSYVPPAVRLVVDRPAAEVPGATLRLEGYVAFRDAGEALRGEDKVRGVQVYVNEFQQRPVTLARRRGPGARVAFSAEVLLNRRDNKIEVECPDLPLEAGRKQEFSVTCLNPAKPATLHLLIVGVGVRGAEKREQLVSQAFLALQAREDGPQGLRSPVFDRVVLHPPAAKPQAVAGYVTAGKVRSALKSVRSWVERQGSPSDVVLIYWLGRGAEKENDQWYLPTYQSRAGQSLASTGVALKELLAADEPTPGARLLLLDVSPSPSEELDVATLSTAHAGVVRCKWSQPNYLMPGLLVALEKAALRQGKVSLGDVTRAAAELSADYPGQPELKHNLGLLPPLAALVLTQKP